MRIFVFRPEAEAERTARALSEQGHEPVVVPLFTVSSTGDEPPPGDVDALLVTSGNALAGLAGLPQARRDLPLFAVGGRTAERAREAGFTDVRQAEGGRDSLAALVRAGLNPPARLLAVLGRDRHEDWLDALAADGFAVSRWTAYEASPVAELPEQAARALRSGKVEAALHYSPRGVRTFLDLARAAGLADEALALPHATLSRDIAEPLTEAGATTVQIADRPEETALFAALERLPAAATVRGKRRTRRNAPVIEATAVEARDATPEPADVSPEPSPETRETQAEAVLPTEALPQEFDPPPVEETRPSPIAAAERRPSFLPLLAAALIGGCVGAGLLFFLMNREAPGVSAQDFAALRNQVQDAERRLAAATDAASKAQAAAQAANQRVEQEAARPAADPQALAGVNEQARKAQSEAEAAQSAAAALGQRLEQTSARIGTVETLAKQAAAPSPQALASARVVLAERVRSALASGRAFPEDVAALAKSGVAADRLAPLQAVAGSGVPTRDALLSEIREARGPLARALVPQDAGWRERLMGIASRLVTVTPPGSHTGSDVAGAPARIEQAVARGDFAAAATIWNGLPEAARAAAPEFGARLQRRAAADAAIGAISKDAVAALGAAG